MALPTDLDDTQRIGLPPAVPVPTKDKHLASLTHTRRIAKFGAFDFTHTPIPPNPKTGSLGEPEHITIAGRWERDNIVRVPTPQLAHLGRPTLRMHKLAAEPLTALLTAWEAAGLLDRILTVNGAFYPRYKRGKSGPSSNLSTHTFGGACDFNAKWNGLGKEPTPLGSVGSMVELIPIAESLGWSWGGWWSRPDAMHLEIT